MINCELISVQTSNQLNWAPRGLPPAWRWEKRGRKLVGMESVLKTSLLFIVTAIGELVGCYLPYIWLRKGGSPWLLVPAAGSLAVFSWLLTLHPEASGRVYAAYGGVYVAMAVLWLWAVDGMQPTRWDMIGATVALTGMAIIMFAPRPT